MKVILMVTATNTTTGINEVMTFVLTPENPTLKPKPDYHIIEIEYLP